MELDVIEKKIACNELTAAQVFTLMSQLIDEADKNSWNSAINAAANLVDFGAGVDAETIKEQLLSA